MLPIGPVRIPTTEGMREVDALLVGDWALNENAKGWTATHRHTGYCGKSYSTPIEALLSLGVLIGAGLVIPDELTTETMISGFAAIPGISEIVARVKAGLAILDSWDLDIDYNEPEVDDLAGDE